MGHRPNGGEAVPFWEQAVLDNKCGIADDACAWLERVASRIYLVRGRADETRAINRSQIVTGSQKHRDPRFPPRAFTQEGVAMLSSILRSKRAIEVNISIMRAFVRLRELLATNEDLARKVAQHDEEIATLFEHVQHLLAPEPVKKNRIGFVAPKE
jgi:hypothetical protein